MALGKGIRAGKAYVELFADNSKLIRGLRLSERQLKAFSDKVAGIGRTMAKLGAITAAPFILGTKVFADFQQQMANVSTMLDEPEKHMRRFTAAIREMSVTYGEGTEALAGGLYDILSASVPAEKALSVLEVAVRAAKAGLTDTATAADTITTILNAYGLSANHAASVSDLLFSIVKRGKTTFGQLAPSIGLVATTAASANVPMEEFGAALATMTRSGVSTENAVTSLNAIVSTFLKSTDEAADLAKSLGFELSSATIQAEGLEGVFNRIASMPPEIIAELFPNIRALRGVLPALKNMAGFTEDIEIMTNRTGRTDEAFEKMARTITTQLNRVKQAGLLVASVIGQALGPAVKSVSDKIVKAAKSTTRWLKANKNLVALLAAVAVGVLAVGAALLATGLLIKTAGVALGVIAGIFTGVKTAGLLLAKVIGKTLVTAFTALTSPIGLVSATVLALGGYFLYTSGLGGKAIDWLRRKFGVLFDAVKDTLGGIGDALAAGDITLAAQILWGSLKLIWRKGVNALKKIWYSLQSWLTAGWFGLVSVAQWAWHGLEVAWIETISFLQRAWAKFQSWHARQTASWAKAFTTAWAWAKSKIDDEFDFEFAAQYIQDDYQSQLERIGKNEREKLNALETERANKRQQAAQLHEETLRAIEEEGALKLTQMDADHAAAIAANEAQLAAVRQQWRAAIQAAKEKKDALEAAADGGSENAFEGLLNKLKESIASVSDTVLGKVKEATVTGTFSAFAIEGLGAGSSADRTAKAAEETAENTRKMLREVRYNGAKFA